jgi:hypothetical protein
MGMNEQRGQKGQAEAIENYVEEARRLWRRSVLDYRVELEQAAGIDREQREDEEEQQPLKQPRAAMSQDQRQQKQVDERPSGQRNQPNVEEQSQAAPLG